MSNTYAPIPASSPPSSPRSSTSTLPPRTRAPPAPTVSFDRPHVPSYQRALLLAAIAVLFWLAFHLGAMGDGNKVDVGAGGKAAGVLDQFGRQVKEKYGGEVVHAKRYSPEFKYRPAASPVIKERLKDGSGKIRLRGANPGGVA